MNKYPPRPTGTREVILKIADDMATRLADSVCAEDIADAYACYGPDGFDIAKELDRNGCDLTADCVATLDGMQWGIGRAVRELEKVWFEENNIQPPLEIGTEIKEGVIIGIHEHQLAYYLVKEYGCTNDGRRLLVRFENAQEVAK